MKPQTKTALLLITQAILIGVLIFQFQQSRDLGKKYDSLRIEANKNLDFYKGKFPISKDQLYIIWDLGYSLGANNSIKTFCPVNYETMDQKTIFALYKNRKDHDSTVFMEDHLKLF